MDNFSQLSDASIYTDFSGLQKLRSKVANPENNQHSEEGVKEANNEVAKQFESLFLQMMLKSMRDATASGDSADTDQTKFYQEMFDKQIAIDLANKDEGGLGIGAMLQREFNNSQSVSTQSISSQSVSSKASINNSVDYIHNQINHSGSIISQAEFNKVSSNEE